jgi:predicted unusual protein kinase regulating ubiquinone biosynthesis (AarF/ABC1/UbiB family)
VKYYLKYIYIKGTDEYTTALQACRRRNAKRFANLCIDTGGVYIKIGQAFVRISYIFEIVFENVIDFFR